MLGMPGPLVQLFYVFESAISVWKWGAIISLYPCFIIDLFFHLELICVVSLRQSVYNFNNCHVFAWLDCG